MKFIFNPDMELIGKQYSKLKRLRDTYRDEIPEEIIHSTSNDRNYKCRAGWWNNVFMATSYLISANVLSRGLGEKYRQTEKILLRHLNENGRTRKEDIVNGNDLIDSVLEELEPLLF